MSGKEASWTHIMYHGGWENENAVIYCNHARISRPILEWSKNISLNLPMERIGKWLRYKHLGGACYEMKVLKSQQSCRIWQESELRSAQFFEEILVWKRITENTSCILIHCQQYWCILTYRLFQVPSCYYRAYQAAGALGNLCNRRGMHDEQAVATLKQLFDGMIEIKSERWIRTLLGWSAYLRNQLPGWIWDPGT